MDKIIYERGTRKDFLEDFLVNPNPPQTLTLPETISAIDPVDVLPPDCLDPVYGSDNGNFLNFFLESRK